VTFSFFWACLSVLVTNSIELFRWR
jgi:hypothetical protein